MLDLNTKINMHVYQLLKTICLQIVVFLSIMKRKLKSHLNNVKKIIFGFIFQNANLTYKCYYVCSVICLTNWVKFQSSTFFFALWKGICQTSIKNKFVFYDPLSKGKKNKFSFAFYSSTEIGFYITNSQWQLCGNGHRNLLQWDDNMMSKC